MKRQQSGFTLVEIAIVLVIIGLLLGGILKGQELINSAKVKNLANDFRVIPTYIYAYQDKYRALPGDDAQASTHLTPPAGGAAATNGDGNGLIGGTIFPPTLESLQFWMHVRYANLAAGPVLVTDPGYIPTNAVGGQISISSMGAGQPLITTMTGTFQVCSRGILGKFAKQLDIQMDDGNTATGSLQVIADVAAPGAPVAGPGLAVSAVTDPDPFVVCYTF